ncbi:MAG: hypothetical protein EOP84_08890, partial [Verrucomicrobiaceae bacterium]
MKKTFLPLLIVFLLARTAVAADFASEVMGATFKLFHPNSTATCFFVRREAPDTGLYLITAAHALERMKGETAIVVLRKQMEDGSYTRHDYTIPIRQESKPLWVRHEKHDIAVMRLADTPPVAVPALSASWIADEAKLKTAGVHICSPLFIFTYPERFEANAAGFPVARKGIFASHPLLPVKTHPTFLADFSAFSGDSGGPTFIEGADGHPLLVGIVLAQYRHDERVTSANEERTIHHPLGLGTILHAEYVLDTLEAVAKQSAPAASCVPGR